MKKLLLCLLAVSMFLVLCVPTVSAAGKIDNSALTPKYVPDDQVKLVEDHGVERPEWVSSLIIAECRIDTLSEEGTFGAATKALDHFKEMGVNGLWVTPIADNMGYTNHGLHSVDPRLTGVKGSDPDYAKGWAVVKKFVDEAHKRNIRVFFDVTIWGTDKESPLVKEHPDWYEGGWEAYSGITWVWSNPGWREYYVNAACDLIRKTGADGFRVDLEPTITGYSVFEEIRDILYCEGHYVAIFSEGTSTRDKAYDFDQGSVGVDTEMPLDQWGNPTGDDWIDYFLKHDIVESCKTGRGIGTLELQRIDAGGEFKYYTYMLSSHDFGEYQAKGSKIDFAYSTLFSPFIPVWYIGEEWNNPRKGGGTGVLYYNVINWDKLEQPENAAFYETVKKYIRIRRTYPEIFEYFPDNHRDTNIAYVTVKGTDMLSYARYAGGSAVLVVPNSNDAFDQKMTVTIPYADTGMTASGNYTVTDLMTGKVIAKGDKGSLKDFKATVEPEGVGLYLVEPENKPAKPTTTTKTTVKTDVPTEQPETPATEQPETAETEQPTSEPVTAETEQPIVEPETAEPEATEPTTGEPVPADQTAFPVWVIPVGIAVIAAAVVLVILLAKKKK